MKKNKFLILGIVFFALAGVMLVGMAAESMRNAEHYSIAYSLLPAVLFAALGAWMMAKIKMPPKKKAEQAGIKVYGLSSYFLAQDERQSHTVILGYANLTPEQIEEGIQRLNQAWR